MVDGRTDGPTNRTTDQRTTRLLELLRAAKNIQDIGPNKLRKTKIVVTFRKNKGNKLKYPPIKIFQIIYYLKYELGR